MDRPQATGRAPRQSEVQHLDGPVLAHLDVRGLEVAVDDARFVRSLQRLRDLLRNGECFINGDRPPA